MGSGIPNIVRTAKAERRLKERLREEGLLSEEDEETTLTPAEVRALRAEKRAAWRQARLKSLEQVINKIIFSTSYSHFRS